VDAYIDGGTTSYDDNGTEKDLIALGSIGTWNTVCITSLDELFYASSSSTPNIFNEDINAWDTSSVTTMRQVFYNAAAFDQNLNSWVTSSGKSTFVLLYLCRCDV
jgi:hypothetical protein